MRKLSLSQCEQRLHVFSQVLHFGDLGEKLIVDRLLGCLSLVSRFVSLDQGGEAFYSLNCQFFYNRLLLRSA